MTPFWSNCVALAPSLNVNVLFIVVDSFKTTLSLNVVNVLLIINCPPVNVADVAFVVILVAWIFKFGDCRSILLQSLPIFKLLVLPLRIVEKTFVALLVASVNVVCGDAFADIARIDNVDPVCDINDGATFAGSLINNWFAVTLPSVEIVAPDILADEEILPAALIVVDVWILPLGSIDAYVIAPGVIWFCINKPFCEVKAL